MSDEGEVDPNVPSARAAAADEAAPLGGSAGVPAAPPNTATPDAAAAPADVAPRRAADGSTEVAPGSSVAQAAATRPAVVSPPEHERPVLPRMALAFLAGAVCLALVLGVQHLRHGWPFSLHHEPAPLDRAEGATAAHAGHDGGVDRHPRVPVHVDEARAAAIGIATTSVEREELSAELRTVATVVPDESRVSHVHTRVAGWVDRLAVRTTGETVRSGEVLGAIFSRELLASQTEFIAALRTATGTSSSSLARGARDRLRVLGMTDAEIDALERRGEPLRNVPIIAPRAGVILHRGVTRGAAVDPSTELFVIADLSEVWVLAEVPEARMAEVHAGSAATLELPSSGVAALEATVDFVYPTLTEGTRTLRVRFVVENTEGSIRPGAFGTAVFHLAPRTAIVVPRDAVVDHGTEQYVFVSGGGGEFEPRRVRVGARFDDRVEILEGVDAGERVVSSGVFLLDSESRLRASGGSMAGMNHGAAASGETETEAVAVPHDMAAMPAPDEPGAESRAPADPSAEHDMADMPGHAP